MPIWKVVITKDEYRSVEVQGTYNFCLKYYVKHKDEYKKQGYKIALVRGVFIPN